MQDLVSLFGEDGAAAYLALVARTDRKPCIEFLSLNEDGSIFADLTPYLVSSSLEFTDDPGAQKANFIFANPQADFDKYGSGPLSQVFAEHRLVQFKKGLTDYETNTSYLLPAFYGRVVRANPNYERGSGTQTIEVVVFDPMKTAIKQRATSDYYQNCQANFVATDIVKRHLKLDDSRIRLADLDYVYSRVQFPDFAIVDMLTLLYSPVKFYCRFDESGNLVTGAKPGSGLSGMAGVLGYPDATSAPPYCYAIPDGALAFSYEPEWGDLDFVNQVRVLGSSADAITALGPIQVLSGTETGGDATMGADDRKTQNFYYQQQTSAQNAIIATNVYVNFYYSTNHELDTSPRLFTLRITPGDRGIVGNPDEAGGILDPTNDGTADNFKWIINESDEICGFVRLNSVTAAYINLTVGGHSFSVCDLTGCRKHGGFDYKFYIYGQPSLADPQTLFAIADYNPQPVTEDATDVFGDHLTWQLSHQPIAMGTVVEVSVNPDDQLSTALASDAPKGSTSITVESVSYGGNILPTDDFSGFELNHSYGTGTVVDGWETLANPDIDFHVAGGYAYSPPVGYPGVWAYTDDAGGEGLLTASPIANTTYGTGFYYNQWILSYDFYTADKDSVQGWEATLIAYSDSEGTAELGRKTLTFKPAFAGQAAGQRYSAGIDFSEHGQSIRSLRFQIIGAATNRRGIGIYFANVKLAPAQEIVYPGTLRIGSGDDVEYADAQATPNASVLDNPISLTAGLQYDHAAGEPVVAITGANSADRTVLSSNFSVDYERGRVVFNTLVYEDFDEDDDASHLFSTGGSASLNDVVFSVSPIDPAAPPQLYQSNRQGDSKYVVDGLTLGQSYNLRLHFADPVDYGTEGLKKRLFSVFVQGASVIDGLDLWNTVGNLVAYSFDVEGVSPDIDGKITLDFTQHDPQTGDLLESCSSDGTRTGSPVGTALVSGIEVIQPQGQGAAPAAINCGGPAIAPTPPTVRVSYAYSPEQEQYGIMNVEVNNPLIASHADCLNTARYNLHYAAWSRNPISVSVASMPHLQVGDVIKCYYHPANSDAYCYVKSIDRKSTRGGGDVDSYELFLLFMEAR